MNSSREKGPPELFNSTWNPGEWVVVRQMISDIDLLFERRHISYFICYGTFLGAVRHQGVIPWDDDIDFGIFSDDELRLKTLEPELNELGYSLHEWFYSKQEGAPVCYKISISSIASESSLASSWPFIDLFVFQPDDTGAIYSDGILNIKKADLLPLKRYPYSGFDLPGPASLKSLETEYGPHFAGICVSNPYNHRFERRREASITASMEYIKAHGYNIDVHLEDQFGLERHPVQLNDIRLRILDDRMELVGSDETRHVINNAMHLIWQWSTGQHTIEQMINSICEHYTYPMIEATIDVIEAIRALYERQLIRIQ